MKLNQNNPVSNQMYAIHLDMQVYGWLVGWGLTALLTQNRSYRACRYILQKINGISIYMHTYTYINIHKYTYNYVSIG